MKRQFTKRKKRVSILLLLTIFSLNFTSLFSQAEHHVSVTNNVFTPSDLTIRAGDKVIWTNSQGNHNVNGKQSTYPSNPESFGNNVSSGWTYEYTFNTPGVYNYRCDPHIGFGMTGTVSVEENTLTLNFSGMTPHAGQQLFLVLKDKDSNDEVLRKYSEISESFSLMLPGILTGHSYEIEFFADHNQNGHYDAPPADHAWELELNDVSGDETLSFSHNTSFRDIEWDHKVFLNFTGFEPHSGQELYIALIDLTLGAEVDRESERISPSFSTELGPLQAGHHYRLDFFADHNDNDLYDIPPVDHAWRLEIPEANGDEFLDFGHGTSFTDIGWKYKLTLRLSGMNPHIGQKITLYLVEQETSEYKDTVVIDPVSEADFDLESFAIEPGKSYRLDFFTDHNGNGGYDAPPTDHAWRITVPEIEGDTRVDFEHNTGFTDIFSPTGIPGLQAENLQIYPNPTSDFFTIQKGRETGEIRYVRIYSSSGGLLKVIQAVPGGNLHLGSEDMGQGIYLLEIHTDNGISTHKLIKR